MPTLIDPETMYFGAPASLTVGGVEVGATLDAPKVAFDIQKYVPEFKNASGPVKSTVIVRKVIPRIEFTVNELAAAKIAWAMPGVTSAVGTGALTAAGHSFALADDVAAGAAVIKFPGVTLANPSAAADDIIDTVAPHGFVANQRVRFESLTGGAGLVVGTDYFVIAANLAATTFQVSLTQGGAAVNFTTDITAGVVIPALVVGQFLRIGDAGETEIRSISAVGTSGAGGTGVTLQAALSRAHDAGDPVVQTVDAGTTIFSWTPGRVPSASYRDVVAIGPGLDGRLMTVTIKNALSAEPIEIPFDDEAMGGLALVMIGHYVYDGSADNGKVPFSLELS